MKKITLFKKPLIALTAIVSISISNIAYAESYSNDSTSDIHTYISQEQLNNTRSYAKDYKYSEKEGNLLDTYGEIVDKADWDKIGGAYFDSNKDLHILYSNEDAYNNAIKVSNIGKNLQSNIPYNQKTISKLFANKSNDIHCEKVKYSYDDLKEFQEKIQPNISSTGAQATGIDQINNKIILYTKDTNSINKDEIKKYINDDAFEIKEENTDCSDDLTVGNGTKFSNNTKSYTGSIACGVVWDKSTSNPKYGFLTAGHMGDVGDSVSYNGYSMGTITDKKQSGSIDAAIIQKGQTLNTFNITNTVSDGKQFTKNGGTWPVNTTIYAYGYKTGISTGEIIDTNYSGSFSGISFTNLVKTSATSNPGDSGGAIITYSSSYDTYVIIGVIKGHDGSNNLVYTNMEEIRDYFDLNVMNN